jgi:hypothetical protein
VCYWCLEQGKEAISREIDSKIISQLAQTSDSDIEQFLSVFENNMHKLSGYFINERYDYTNS